MNYKVLLPVVSQMLGRDVSGDVDLFFRARAAVGESLNEEGQEFFIKNYPSIVDFMETKEGQEAITTFLDAWVRSRMPKTLGKETEASIEQTSESTALVVT